VFEDETGDSARWNMGCALVRLRQYCSGKETRLDLGGGGGGCADAMTVAVVGDWKGDGADADNASDAFDTTGCQNLFCFFDIVLARELSCRPCVVAVAVPRAGFVVTLAASGLMVKMKEREGMVKSRKSLVVFVGASSSKSSAPSYGTKA